MSKASRAIAAMFLAGAAAVTLKTIMPEPRTPVEEAQYAVIANTIATEAVGANQALRENDYPRAILQLQHMVRYYRDTHASQDSIRAAEQLVEALQILAETDSMLTIIRTHKDIGTTSLTDIEMHTFENTAARLSRYLAIVQEEDWDTKTRQVLEAPLTREHGTLRWAHETLRATPTKMKIYIDLREQILPAFKLFL
jgi:hypothetical protein